MRVRGRQSSSSTGFTRLTNDSLFDSRHHDVDHSAVYLLRPPSSSAPSWVVAAANDDYDYEPQLLHPLTFKYQVWNLPRNFDFYKLNPTTIAVAHTTASFDKLLIVPAPKSNCTSDELRNCTMFALYDGGILRGCPRYSAVEEKEGRPSPWINLSYRGRFDDIVTHKGKIYVIDRGGRLIVINNYKKSRKISLGKTLILDGGVNGGSGRFGWRKRLVSDGRELYLVARCMEKWIRVYKLIRREKSVNWVEVHEFDGGKVLFMARDYCLFRHASTFPGKEFKNCVVFSEGAFPQYGKDCWEMTRFARHLGFVRKCEDEIAVFRLGVQKAGNAAFPKINWAPPSWIFGAWSLASAGKTLVYPVSESSSQSESEPVEDEGLDANSIDEEEEGSDANSVDEEDEGSDAKSIDEEEEGSDEDEGLDANSMDEEDEGLDTNVIDVEDEDLDANIIDVEDEEDEGLDANIIDVEDEEDEGLDANSIDEKDEDRHDLKDSSSKEKKDGDLHELNASSSKDEKDGDMHDLKDSSSKDEDGDMHALKDPSNKNEKPGDEGMHSSFNGHDKKHRGTESDSDSRNQEDGNMQCDSNSQEKEDEQMHRNPNIDDGASLQENISPSLFGPESETTDTVAASLSAAEKEVTRTLLSMNGGNVAIEAETSKRSITQSVLSACTSSTAKSHNSDSGTAKFEGFDVRPDLVPTLQKIWGKYGNIIENSIMRSGDIVARALESLATMVRILEDNSAQSLSDFQANYLTSTLSDLRCICFKVHWLIPFVEKAIQLHKSKPLVDSLHNLLQLSSQVKKRREILFGELSKLHQEENKLKDEIAKVSKMIPLHGEVKFDEPLGLGLT